MRRRTLLALPLLAPVAARAASAPLPVVATFSILADMARQIGGPDARVTGLVPPDGDAHSYQPKPSDLRALRGARMVVNNGLGLEGWMDRLIQSSGYRGPAIVASASVSPRTIARLGGGGVTDPHAWQDPRNGVLYAQAIIAGYVAADPERADAYRARGAAFIQQIRDVDTFVTDQIASVPEAKRKILTSHDAFGYFGARFGVEFYGIEGLSTESEPSAADIAGLIRLIRRDNIRAVFVENMTNPQLARTVARETGAVVGPPVYSDALSPPGGPADTYIKMFRHNVPLFVAGMRANP